MATHEDLSRKPVLTPPSERSFAVVWAVFLAVVGLLPLWRHARDPGIEEKISLSRP